MHCSALRIYVREKHISGDKHDSIFIQWAIGVNFHPVHMVGSERYHFWGMVEQILGDPTKFWQVKNQ